MDCFLLSSANELEVNEILSKNPNITIDQARNYAIQRQVDLKKQQNASRYAK